LVSQSGVSAVIDDEIETSSSLAILELIRALGPSVPKALLFDQLQKPQHYAVLLAIYYIFQVATPIGLW